MMTTAGSVELACELPAGVEIDEVVVGELLALQLPGARDAGARAVGVERRLLVRVFAVAQDGGLALDQANRFGELAGVEAAGACGVDRRERLERGGDPGVVGRGDGEGLLGQSPARARVRAPRR